METFFLHGTNDNFRQPPATPNGRAALPYFFRLWRKKTRRLPRTAARQTTFVEPTRSEGLTKGMAGGSMFCVKRQKTALFWFWIGQIEILWSPVISKTKQMGKIFPFPGHILIMADGFDVGKIGIKHWDIDINDEIINMI